MTVRARSVGAYYTVTERPTSGEIVRDDQLAWLAGAAPGLVSELAAYKHADATLRARAFDALTQLAPLEDGYTAATGTHVFDPLARAQRYALAAGLALTRTNAGLQLGEAAIADAASWSHGAIVEDLGAQKIFGPRVDFHCECGKHTRMRDKGVVCETCGVAVLSSRVRAVRFGHIVLPRPLTPSLFAEPWTNVPVLPAGLRGDPRALYLDAAYATLLARPSVAALDEVLHEAMRLFHNALLPSTPRFSDYTGAAVASIGSAVRAPLELLTELLRPTLYGLCIARGHAASIRDAKQFLIDQPTLVRELIGTALQDRVVLLASPKGPELVATAIAVGDAPVIELTQTLAQRLEATSGDEIVVHLPITDAGQIAAKQLAPEPFHDTYATWPDSGPEGWIDRLDDVSDIGLELTSLARRNAIDPCTSPRAAFLVGGYPPTVQ